MTMGRMEWVETETVSATVREHKGVTKVSSEHNDSHMKYQLQSRQAESLFLFTEEGDIVKP